MKETQQHIGGYEVYGRELTDLSEAIVVMEAIKHRGETSLGEESLNINYDSDPWSGTRNIDEAIRIARYGWPEGRELIKDTLDEIDTDELVGLRRTMEPYVDVAGDEVDVDRYLAGDHENMVQFALKYDQNGKVVTLFVNATMSSYIEPQQIVKRGAALVAAKEILTSSGYAMGITMVESATSSRGRDIQTEYHIPLISPGEYLDVDTAAFCLAHPSFLRRLIFALNDNESTALRRTMGFHPGGSYGQPANIALPLPRSALVIDKHEGPELKSQADIVKYTKRIVQRAAEKLETAVDE